MDPASPANNYHYNAALKPLANKLRKEMSKAEACLWKYALRASQMHGYSFRRQRPVLSYIADFACLPLQLVIEVDGSTHRFPEVYARDVAKTAALEAVGFTVLRFANEEVLHDMEEVKRTISHWIQEHGE